MRPWSTSVNTPLPEEETLEASYSDTAYKRDETTEELSSWAKMYRKATTASVRGAGVSRESQAIESSLGVPR
ncbi:MAG: hypothetical protein COA78_25105 [Blastopirellula sp.]|nr:MAG: hypothetical protein COA78_25105 [Blastopirellula sp.]